MKFDVNVYDTNFQFCALLHWDSPVYSTVGFVIGVKRTEKSVELQVFK